MCIIDTPRLQSTEKCRAMMICSPFSGLLPPLSSIHNSKNKSNLRKIHVWIKEALRRAIGSHFHDVETPSSKNNSSWTQELESLEMSCEWMFTGPGYFQRHIGPCPVNVWFLPIQCHTRTWIPVNRLLAINTNIPFHSNCNQAQTFPKPTQIPQSQQLHSAQIFGPKQSHIQLNKHRCTFNKMDEAKRPANRMDKT